MKHTLTPKQIQKLKELALVRLRLENLETRLQVAKNRLILIPKQDLIPGAYYQGRCRNATIARWTGTVFLHWHYEFGQHYVDRIPCPEDEARYDVFQAWEQIPAVVYIPWEDQ